MKWRDVMVSSLRRFGAVALLGLAACVALPALAHAQRPVPIPPQRGISPVVPGSIVPFPINPNFRITPYMTLNQYAYNTAVLGQALQNVPPYALGYNPYP